MGQTVSSCAGVPMGRGVIGSKDASAFQKGSSVRKKVKQGNTVVGAMFGTFEQRFPGMIVAPETHDPQVTSVSIHKLGRIHPKSLRTAFLLFSRALHTSLHFSFY